MESDKSRLDVDGSIPVPASVKRLTAGGFPPEGSEHLEKNYQAHNKHNWGRPHSFERNLGLQKK